jgi:hypothetical protein
MKHHSKFFVLNKDERRGAATIFFLLFIGPLLLLGWIKVLSEIATGNGWASAVMIGVLFFLTAILVSLVVPTVRNHRTQISLLSSGYAVVWLAGIYAFGGAWILATGTTGGRVNFHEVPRSDSISYFIWAALLALIGLGATVIGRRRRATSKNR